VQDIAEASVIGCPDERWAGRRRRSAETGHSLPASVLQLLDGPHRALQASEGSGIVGALPKTARARFEKRTCARCSRAGAAGEVHKTPCRPVLSITVFGTMVYPCSNMVGARSAQAFHRMRRH
jgi:hypothetical protein